MARHTEALCRLCRREGMKLFLKGDRCVTEKCAFSRRPYIPGMHHEAQRKKISEYGRQLREKQKVKRIYGVLERQFRRYFEEANRRPGGTGENLLKILETRLDNVIHRSGFTTSRREARKLVAHGHARINGKKVDIPSYEVKAGDKISLSEKALNLESVKKSISEAFKKRTVPTWIEMNFEKREAAIKNAPARTDITIPVQEQLIVELYSK
ncbi:MAG TPA: 30S ribosomal protein S4 [Candidatus Goldiibacteriota bacterium]|nr:30S ribosomal protein S4 [Candidatus Goldiibacteriota bacterium]